MSFFAKKPQTGAPPPAGEPMRMDFIGAADPLSMNTRVLLERLHDDVRKAKDPEERDLARRFMLEVMLSLRGAQPSPQFAAPTIRPPREFPHREPMPGSVEPPPDRWRADELAYHAAESRRHALLRERQRANGAAPDDADDVAH